MNTNFETAYLNAGGKASDLEKEDGAYVSSKAQIGWEMWQAKSQSVAEGFVLIKNNSKTIVAIEKMVEQQVEASGITWDVFRLDGEKILEAMIEAQGESHE